MGGSGFGDKCAKRLEPAEYAHVKSAAEPRLRELFDKVASPPVDPGKKTHGDVDFVVCGPRAGTNDQTIADALGALECVQGAKGNPTSMFLVRVESSSDVPRYAQIDVHRCVDVDEYNMVCFKHSHGRIGVILGGLLHAVGLCLKDQGLYLNKEKFGRPSFMISNKPDEIMNHLQLDDNAYKAGFKTRQAMFEWLEQTRIGSFRIIDYYRGNPAAGVDDEQLLEWCVRCAERGSGPRLEEAERQELGLVLLREFGKETEYKEWQAGQDAVVAQEEARKAAIKAEKAAVAAEVNKRLMGRTERGKELGKLASQLSAEIRKERAHMTHL